MHLRDIQTPALILDQRKLTANTKAMTHLITGRGVHLRPHMKTAKSIDVARIALKGNFGGITVATLNEAEYFATHGVNDILYGVCVTPDKLNRIIDLQKTGIRITLITDSLTVAKILADCSLNAGITFNVMLEIDCGEHRTGIAPEDPILIDIAKCLHSATHINLVGVFTHAGHSYRCRSKADLERISEDERCAVIHVANKLRSNDLPCQQVSVGSTPTALHAPSVKGVTEVRAGIYMFNDLFQAEIYSCGIDDIAVSVLTTVISHDIKRNRLHIDAGGLALSKDRSTANTDHDAGYGRLIDLTGQDLIRDLCVTNTHQEHGEITSSVTLPFNNLPIGSRVRVLPNHACMTSAMYDCYHVVDGDSNLITEIWPRTNGWRTPNI